MKYRDIIEENKDTRRIVITFYKDEDEESEYLPDDNGIERILYHGLDEYYHCQYSYESDDEYIGPLLEYYEKELLEDETFLMKALEKIREKKLERIVGDDETTL